MNKANINEIALRVAKERYVAQHGGTGEGINFTNYAEFTHALLAELAKVQEPVAYYSAHRLIPDGTTEVYGYTETKLQPGTPLYLQPHSQPVLIAEIERLKTIADNYYAIAVERSQQLSTAQTSEAKLLKALEKIVEDSKDTHLSSMPHLGRTASKAIYSHKERKEGK